MCLLNNDSTGFHISGVCSDVCSFNRIMRWIWKLLTRFDRDVIDSAVNSTAFFTVSPSAVYNGVAWSRAAEQITVFFRADNGVERIRFAFGSFVQCSSCKSGMKRTQGCPFFFQTEKQPFFDWRRIVMTSRDNYENLQALVKIAEFACFCDKIIESQNPGGTECIYIYCILFL